MHTPVPIPMMPPPEKAISPEEVKGTTTEKSH